MIIQKLDGIKIDLAEIGIKLLAFNIDSLSPRHVTEEIEGRDGHIDLGTMFSGRTMRASFFMRAADNNDYYRLRNDVFRLFESREPFYLIHNERQPDRRWLVKTAQSFTPEKIGVVGKFEVSFISSSPYAESVSSTLHPAETDYIFQIGANKIDDGDPPIQYVFNTNSFAVWNDGDVTVDPRCFPLVISFKGASTNLKIKNNTTSDEWQYIGTTASGDTIELNGIRSLKNGQSIFGQTNRKLITLAPGWNEFEVVGATGDFEVSFDFRFYYV